MINAKIPVVMRGIYQYLVPPEYVGETMFVYECLYPPGKLLKNHSITMLLLLIHGIDANQFIEVKRVRIY